MEPKTSVELLRKYDEVGSFHEDLAAVRKGEEYFHIHPDGTPAYEQRFAFAGAFFQGLAVVWDMDGGHYHIRHDGSPAYRERYDFVGPFSRGPAVVCNAGKKFHINPDGTRVENL